MKAIYIAGPYRGQNSLEVELNIRRAEMLAFEVAQLGLAFHCPHTNSRFFDGTLDDGYWLRSTMEMMERCDGVVMVWGWPNSVGAIGERARAQELGLPVFETIEELAQHKWTEQVGT